MSFSALSPLDSRYYNKVKDLIPIFSDDAFVLGRTKVEIHYLAFLLNRLQVEKKETIEQTTQKLLNNLSPQSVVRINEIEKTTNHDVKAIEYYLREALAELGLNTWHSYIHYGLTSQDINSLTLSINIKQGVFDVVLPLLNNILQDWETKANAYKSVVMCGHTHGQISSPTLLGKEILVFHERLTREKKNLEQITNNITCKFGGATGNFSAHHLTHPNSDWRAELSTWIGSQFGIKVSTYTTQIDNYESYAEVFDCLCRINRICVNFSRDMWLYGLKKYILMQKKEDEIGSSTMPHKINPIQFEHAEGVLMLANSMGHFFSDKLPQSRLQRDLTDSVVLRFLGEFFGMAVDGYRNLLDGLGRLSFNLIAIAKDVDLCHCELIAEGIQMILRKHQIDDAYEKVKLLTRGKTIDINDYETWVNTYFTGTVAQELLNLNPHSYLGIKK